MNRRASDKVSVEKVFGKSAGPAEGHVVRRWNGPYLKKAKNLLDPWGRPYQYNYPVANGEYEVYSLGPSGKAASASAGSATTFRGS
jgi:hypothetical protein